MSTRVYPSLVFRSFFRSPPIPSVTGPHPPPLPSLLPSLSGALRGSGQQSVGSLINAFSYYAVALPLCYLLTFWPGTLRIHVRTFKAPPMLDTLHVRVCVCVCLRTCSHARIPAFLVIGHTKNARALQCMHVCIWPCEVAVLSRESAGWHHYTCAWCLCCITLYYPFSFSSASFASLASLLSLAPCILSGPEGGTAAVCRSCGWAPLLPVCAGSCQIGLSSLQLGSSPTFTLCLSPHCCQGDGIDAMLSNPFCPPPPLPPPHA